jgi:hypothetical protein
MVALRERIINIIFTDTLDIIKQSSVLQDRRSQVCPILPQTPRNDIIYSRQAESRFIRQVEMSVFHKSYTFAP